MKTADEVRARIRELERLIPELQGELHSLHYHPAIQEPAYSSKRYIDEGCDHLYIGNYDGAMRCMICKTAVVHEPTVAKKKRTNK